MKKLILLLITITTLTNISYASFPVMENTQTDLTILSKDVLESGEDESEPSLIIYILRGVLMASVLFFLIRLWWKALDKKSIYDPWYESKLVKILGGIILIIAWPLGLLYLLYLLYKEGRDSSNKWYKGLALVGTIVWLIGFALFLAFALTFGGGFSGG